MTRNRGTSSSEQYAKKSNRLLLFVGILAIIVFFVLILLMSGGNNKKAETVETEIWGGASDIDDVAPKPKDVDVFYRGEAKLKADPEQISMDRVVIGSKVDAILTLTAENKPIQFLKVDFVQQQADGFTFDTTCSADTIIQPGENCIVKIMWNPVKLQQLQNNLIVTWKESSTTAFNDFTTNVLVKGQSIDSECCVTCEDSATKKEAEPRMAMGLDGNLYEVDKDGYITLPDGTRVKVTDNGLFIDENGNIVGIIQPEYIALNMKNEVIGNITPSNEVTNANGESIGKLLGDKTIVDSKLTVLGAGVPVLPVMNKQGEVVGKMTKDGTVVDAQGKVIGKVWVDGQAVALDGTQIGYIRPWGLVADFNGKIIGGIISDGRVFNAKNETVAQITPGGFAINTQGELVGATIPQGVAVGAGCQSLGKVLLNGDVRDSFDQIIGTALIDGTIVNTKNEEIGSVISQGLVINESGSVVGFVNSEGKAVSGQGKVIGCVNPNGTISAGKRLVGSVLAKGHVIGYSCNSIGSVFPSGEVYNSALNVVGKVMPDGFVKDAENKIIGLVVTRAAAVANGCRLLGLVSITGEIIDLSKKVVGCLTPEKTVVDSSGKIVGSIAPRGVVYKDDGSILGRVRLDGKVMDLQGKVIGCYNADGTITTLSGEILAHGKQGDGVILDADGNPTGWTRIGNEIFDANGNKIGEVNSNNVIVDANGRYIGFIPENGVIFSPEGLIIGRYSSKIGYAVNQNNERFGRILPNNTVVSADTGEVVGGLIPDNAGFIDKGGKLLGYMKVDGTLTDNEGNIIGAIRGDGTVIDKDGNVIGYRILEGRVVSMTGKDVGTVMKDGTVVSGGHTTIGHVDGLGLAVSENGKILGAVMPKLGLGYDGVGLLGYMAPDGTMTDNSGSVIGKALPFGLIVSADGTAIGKLRDMAVYVNQDNKTIGWISFEGTLKGKDNRVVGNIKPAGLATDKNNNLIGYAINKGIVVDGSGKMISTVSVNNKILQKEKYLGVASSTKYVYSMDDKKLGQVLQPGIAVNNDGGLLGWTLPDGTIGTNKGSIGRVLFDNKVVNTKGAVIGSYIPFGTTAFDDKGQTIGLVNQNGEIVTTDEMVKGKIRGTDTVVRGNNIVGQLLSDLPYISNNLLGKTSGAAQLNGEVVNVTNGKSIGSLMTNNFVTSFAGQLVATKTPLGVAVNNSLATLGELNVDGSINGNKGQDARVSGSGAIYDAGGKISGSVLPISTFINKTGGLLGKNGTNNQIVDRTGKQIAVQMPFGTALTVNNIWAGGTLPSGMAVNDDAVQLGATTADGVILDENDMIVGRVLSDGAVINVSDRELFNTMPYLGGMVSQGIPFSYRNKVLGATTVNGDVIDSTGVKLFRILDDATILGKDEPLVGSILPILTAVSHSGEFLGTLGADGRVILPTGEAKGKIAVNETVKGEEFEILGALVPRRTITNDCQIIGVSAMNGYVVNARGAVVGRVKPDKWAVSPSGEKIGRVTRNGLVISETGEYLGRTLTDSTVVDLSGVNLGCAKNDGTVVDNNGNVIGKVVERGLVLGKDGKPLGRIKADGSVVNAKGEVVGKVLANGDVVDEYGNVIGHNIGRDQEILYDENGNIKGTFGTDGTFYDSKTGKAVFRVDENGNVYDANGNLIGKYKGGQFTTLNGDPMDEVTLLVDKNGNAFGIVSDCEVLSPTGGEVIAKIQPDGNVVDMNGEVKYRILGTGVILDTAGNEIGKVSGTSVKLDKCGIKSMDAVSDDIIGRLKDGILYDKDGNVIGELKDGILYDKDGNIIGYVKDGIIYDKDGNIIGYIDENGNVHLYGKSGDGVGTGEGVAGRAIFIGNKKYNITSDGKSIVTDDGTIIGYMGEDGKPYTLDNRQLTASGDAAGRSRPNFAQRQVATPEQIQKMKDLLTKKRESMKTNILERGKITAGAHVKAMSRQKKDANWKGVPRSVSSWPVDMSRMILQDKAIPAVLVRSVDSRFSDVPVTAIVERHVYAEKGRNILIPAGSRVIGKMSSGSYNGRVAKMEITWERLIRPDGGAFKFTATSGDAQGRGGVAAYLDDQLINKYGKPVMTSVVTSAVSYMMAANDDYTQNVNDGTTTQSSKSQAVADARESFISAMDRIFNNLIEDATSIPNVVFVPSGTRITIFSQEDLWLRSEEDDIEEYANSSDYQDMSQAQKPNTSSWVDKRTGGDSETEEDEDTEDEEDSEKSDEDKKSELPNYYQPNDSYKSSSVNGNDVVLNSVTSSTNEPVYDGTANRVVEDIPLKERAVVPVLPKSGTSSRLF